MRKILSVVLVLLLSLAFITGCASQSPEPQNSGTEQTDKASNSESATTSQSTEPVVLKFWNGFTGPDGETLKEVVNSFNQANEGKIEVQMDIMSWDNINEKLPPSIATNSAPGLVLLVGDFIPQYLVNDSLKPLEDFWEKSGLSESDYVDSVLEGAKYNGQYYSLPMQFNLIYLYWNKDLFEKAGLDSETPPATLEEMGVFAEKLTDPANNQFGLGLAVESHPEYWNFMFWNNGGELFDGVEKKSLINSSENLETLTWMQDLVVNKKVSPANVVGADLDNMMTSGRLGMVMTGPWLMGALKENNINFGIGAIPKGSVKQQMLSGQVGFCVPSSATEAEQLAAYEFVKYWMSDEVLKEWSMSYGFPVWKKSLLEDPDIQADPILNAISPLNELGRAYNPAGFNAINAISHEAVWPMIESVFVGGVSPEDALKTADEAINKIFTEND